MSNSICMKVKTNIANAVNSKAGTSLNNSSAWNDIKNAIDNIYLGKKYASGSTISGSNTVMYIDINGS